MIITRCRDCPAIISPGAIRCRACNSKRARPRGNRSGLTISALQQRYLEKHAAPITLAGKPKGST